MSSKIPDLENLAVRGMTYGEGEIFAAVSAAGFLRAFFVFVFC